MPTDRLLPLAARVCPETGAAEFVAACTAAGQPATSAAGTVGARNLLVVSRGVDHDAFIER